MHLLFSSLQVGTLVPECCSFQYCQISLCATSIIWRQILSYLFLVCLFSARTLNDHEGHLLFQVIQSICSIICRPPCYKRQMNRSSCSFISPRTYIYVCGKALSNAWQFCMQPKCHASGAHLEHEERNRGLSDQTQGPLSAPLASFLSSRSL